MPFKRDSFAGDYDTLDLFQKDFPAYLTAMTVGSNGIPYYTWTEQCFDAGGGNGQYPGAFVTADSPRSGDSVNGPFLQEINGNEVSLPRYAIIRLRGIVDGQPYYDFECCCALPGSSTSSSSVSSSSVSSSSSRVSSSSVSQSSAACPCPAPGQPSSITYTTNGSYTLYPTSPCHYSDGNGHSLVIVDNGTDVVVELTDGADFYAGYFSKPFNCCGPWELENITCNSASCPAYLRVYPFCCNNVSPYPCSNCFNGKAPGTFYFSYMGQSYTVQAFSACQWGNVNSGPLPTVQIQQQPTPPPPLPPYFYTVTLITPDGNEYVQSIYQSTPLIDCCQDFYLRWVYSPNPGNPNVPSIVQLTSYDCGCPSSSSSSQSSQSQSSQPSQGSCCDCAYTIQSYLSWGLDGHGNRADLDLYVFESITGQVAYFADLNPPGSNLTHSCDGCPECDIDLCCPNPAFELVNSIAPFTQPCVFEAWYSQYSDCASVVYPTTAQFQVNNVGSCIITVNGSPVLPGRTLVIQPIADAGYNTGAVNNFTGGTVINVQCLYNCSSSSSSVSSSSVSSSSVSQSSKQSSSSLVSCSSGNCTSLTVVTNVWCDSSCNGTLYWTTATVCVPSCIQVSQTFPGNNGLTAQVVTSIVDCPDNVGPEFTVAYLVFPDCTKVGDGQPDCQQGVPLTVVWNYAVVNYCDIEVNRYTICLPSGTCIY